jgi:hypothetical protein
METIDFSDSKYNHLRCTYDADDNHIFKDAIKLPCGNTFCLECVKKFINDKKKCKCDQNHADLDIEKIEIDQKITKEVNENASAITEEIISKLLAFAESMKGITNKNMNQKLIFL